MNMLYRILIVVFIIGLSGCDNSSPSESELRSISGYIEDDIVPNANIVVTDVNGQEVGSVSANDEGLYTLEGLFEQGETYYIKASGILAGRDIIMNGVFIFDENNININVNPLTEIVYKLYLKGKTVALANKETLQYFGDIESSAAVNKRFLMDSLAYQGMKKNVESGIPLDSIENFIKEIELNTTNLRELVREKLVIIPASIFAEVNSAVEVKLNTVINENYEVIWIGLEQDNSTSSVQVVETPFVGDRVITVRVFDEGVLIQEASTTINFYKEGEPRDILIDDKDIEVVETIDDFSVTIPVGAGPEGIDKITVTNIDTGKDGAIRTIKLEPSGIVFSEPVILRIPYDLATIEDPSALYIERLEDDGTMEFLKAEVDYKNQELIIKTDHFSTLRIVKDEDKRELISSLLDIEDILFTTSGGFGIKLPGIHKGNFSELVYAMTRSDVLTDTAKARMQEFYDDGYRLKLDGFSNSYEKAFQYVLAEKTGSKEVELTKYEVLVDSLKKYRIAELILRYNISDMLKVPYKHFVYGSTTRSDFINEIVSVEKESWGLKDGFKATSNMALSNYKNVKSSAKSINKEYLAILENGFLATGAKFAFNAGYGYALNFAKKEIKQQLGKHLTNESLTHLQCFDYSDGSYMIGEDIVFSLNEEGEVSNENLGKLYEIVDFASDMQLDYATVASIPSDLSHEQLIFMECVYRKNQLLRDDTTLTGEFITGGKALASKIIRVEIYKSLNKLYKMVSEGKVSEYNSILKILNYSKTELEEYKDYLKALAFANAETIITSIIIEKKLIDGESYSEMKGSDPEFFKDFTTKKEAFIKFRRFYIERELRASFSETGKKVKIFTPKDFQSLKFALDKKYMEYFSLDLVSLDIKSIGLEAKLSEDGIIHNYYESIGDFESINPKKYNIKLEDFTFNNETEKYEITLGELFGTLDIPSTSYLDINLAVTFTYKDTKYSREKVLKIIIDEEGGPEIETVAKGELKVVVTDSMLTEIQGVEVKAGDSLCVTDLSGICALKNLIPSEYDVSVYKEGYLAEHKISFIDVGINKELGFTLEEYDTESTSILDVSAVRSEVNSLEFNFYISSLGGDDIEVDFGDGTILKGAIVSILSGKSYITHEYTSTGVKSVTIKVINSSTDEILEKRLTVYPTSSSKIVDVVFLVDLSGSYGSSLDNFKSQSVQIAGGFSSLGADVRIGLASFDEFPEYANSDDFAYNEDHSLTYNVESFNYAVNNLSLKWGGDGPESQLEGLYQIATSFNWNDRAEKYIFIATDASFHNSDEEPEYPGPGYKKTLESLKEKGITVIGLNRGSAEILDVTTVTTDTGGVVFNLDSASSDIVDKIVSFSETREVVSRGIFSRVTVGEVIQGEVN